MSWYKHLEMKWRCASKQKQTLTYIGIYSMVFIIGFLVAYYPFLRIGKSFVWNDDGRTQHYPYFVYVGQYLRQIFINAIKGNFAIPLFDFSIGSGDDIIGFLNGQWATDPLLLLSAFVPLNYSEYLYDFLTIFRVYLSGLSFLFLCDYFKKAKIYSLIGGIVYCFSGYSIFCSMRHPGFMNPMIILPLLIVGTDKVLKKEHLYLFAFAILYASLCGYYHLYMMTIMLGIYFFIRFFDFYKINYFKNFIQVAVKGALGYCLGIGLSAVIFFPGIFKFLNAGRSGFSNYNGSYSWPYYYTRFLRLIAPPANYDDMALAAIVLFALVVLFFSKRRYSLKILTVTTFAIYLTSIGGFIMNGFQYSSNRWTFGLVLLASFVVVEMLPELLDLSGKQQLICLAVLGVYIVTALSRAVTRKLGYVLIGIVFLALTAMVLMMQIKLEEYMDVQKNNTSYWKKYIRSFLCLLLILVNVGINGIYKFAPDQGNYSAGFAKSGYEIKRLENAMEREMESYLLTNPIGRVDSSSFTLNTSMVWKIPGILYYSSVINKNLAEFWNKVENSQNVMPFKMESSDQRTIINALLSTMYHVESERNFGYVPYGYEPIKKTEAGNLVYKNNYALPWGYTYDTIIPYDDLDRMNGISIQETMLQAIALENVIDNTAITTIQYDGYKLPYEMEFNNCKWENNELLVSDTNATITLNFTMPAGVEGYIRLAGFEISESGLDVFSFRINHNAISKRSYARSSHHNYYFGRENYLFNLGYSEEERSSLTIIFPRKGTFKLEDIELHTLPMDNYPARIEALRAESLENIEWSTNCLTGTVDLSKDKVLCVSVPYSKGWSAKVDGEKVEILRGNYMFMAIPLTAGHHDIEFNYFSPGLKLGIIVTIICCGILICMLIHDRKKDKQKGKEDGTS